MVEQLTIGNEQLRVTFLPRHGGNISSIVDLSTGAEFLLSPSGAYGDPYEVDFADAGRGGLDECLPGISQCTATDSYPAVPDHGELWFRTWQVLEHTEAHIVLRAAGLSGLELTRHAVLKGCVLDLSYRLRNKSSRDRSWIWSSHPLLKVDEGDIIRLPDQVSGAKVSFSSSPAFASHSQVSWPVEMREDRPMNLDVVPAPDGTTAYKLFVNARPEGWCALHRVQLRRLLRLNFSAEEIPWIGLWLCYGGWPSHAGPRQYTVALEPTTAPTDSLAEAVAVGTASLLKPGQSKTWSMSVSVLPWPDA